MNLPVGRSCTCGGKNPACFKCGGWGFVSGPSDPTYTPRRLAAKKVGPLKTTATCPVCKTPIKPKNLERHLLTVHPQVESGSLSITPVN